MASWAVLALVLTQSAVTHALNVPERTALLAVYNATNGVSWGPAMGWDVNNATSDP
jgi:hypothetical protein